MLAVAGDTDGSDVAIALIVVIPSTIAAIGGVLAAIMARRASGHAKAAQDEVRSPNGIKTGDAIHSQSKRLESMEIRQERMEGRQERMAEGMREMASAATEGRVRQELMLNEQRGLRADQQKHLVDDGLRFGAVFQSLGIEDPVT
ncbi:MAG: hypothetical protein FJ038_04320 [Chloroflexi bacterium]|nr:hypothetical protein [Chloroflexota bacterium]